MKKILSLFLVMIAVLTCGVSVNAKESRELSSAAAQDNIGVVYNRVTNIKDLTDGAKVLIASADGSKTLGFRNTNDGYEAISTADGSDMNKIIGGSDTIELTYNKNDRRKGSFKFPNGDLLTPDGQNSILQITFNLDKHVAICFENAKTQELGITGNVFKFASGLGQIGIYKRSNEVVNPTVDFTTFQTKSSLVATLNPEKQALENVKLRLGGVIPKESFNANNEYGVIALDSTNMEEIANLRSLTIEGLTALKNAKHALQIKKPALVGDGYQFAWVINNIPEDKFDFEFYAVMYEVSGDTIKVSKCVVRSVRTTADEYVKKEAELNFEEDLMVAIKKLATKEGGIQ